jgi:hypothetical protein
MARNGDNAIWAVVVPATGPELRAAITEAWERLVGGDQRDRNLHPWTLKVGGDHTVVVDYNPDSIDILDLALIRLLSKAFPGPHYLVHLEDDAGRIAVYLRGRRQRWLQRTAAELAAELGVQLPGTPEPVPPEHAPLYGCLVVEGMTPQRVAAVIAASDATHHVSLERGKIGCLVYPASQGAPPPRLSPLLSRVLRKATLYTILTKPAEGRFHVSVDRDGAVVGIFDLPSAAAQAVSGVARLPDILGEAVPERILAAFGVDPDRLGLESEGITEPNASSLWQEDEPTWRADDPTSPALDDDWEDDPSTATEG